MRRIVHLSDLHFGWNEAELVDCLRDVVANAKPDVTVLSGDFVEHATPAEFEQASRFIKSLSGPLIMVPGNHDLPFYNFCGRMVQGLSLYRKYITDDMCPFYQDDEVAVMGVNTARIWPLRNGSINPSQVKEIEERLCTVPRNIARLLVTHHPFDLPAHFRANSLVRHGAAALERLACCLDVLLAGHMHSGSSGRVADRFHTPNGALVFVQAGTAISKRYKGERNSFNIIDVEGRQVRVQKYTWDGDQLAYGAMAGAVKEFVLD